MDTTYTKVGGDLFNWERLRPLEIATRYLWVGLYISHRRTIIGLWNAGLPTIADVAKMQPDDALTALDELLQHDLVEYDRNKDVLRLTEFPDRCERPQNPSHLQSIWTRYRGVPNCPVKYAHVETLEWLLTDPIEAPKPSMIEQWQKTFGTIPPQAHRKRGVRRLLDDSDTSTAVQPSLFTQSGSPVVHPTKSDTVSDTVSPHPLIYDQRSKISDLPIRESNGRAEIELPIVYGEIPLGVPPPTRPSLALVPLPADTPFTIDQMLHELEAESAGRFAAGPLDHRLSEPLYATIRACGESRVGLDDLRVVGRWLAAGGLAFRSDLGPAWVAKPGTIIDAVGSARAWIAAGGGVVGKGRMLRQEPAPVGAHGTGKRRL